MGDYREGLTIESANLRQYYRVRGSSLFPKPVSGRATTKQMSFEDWGIKRSVCGAAEGNLRRLDLSESKLKAKGVCWGVEASARQGGRGLKEL